MGSSGINAVHGDCSIVRSRDRFWFNQYKRLKRITMAYSWDNRVKFVVRYMYDIEGNGDWNEATFKKNQEVMANLWNEIAELADFNKDGEVSTDEFMKAIQTNCVGKSFNDFPNAFKTFISGAFQAIDVDGDGSVGLTEFRVDCVNRMAYKNIADLDAAYNKLLNDEDKKVGGISLARYQELYAQFIGNPDESCPAVNLFGPLEVIG